MQRVTQPPAFRLGYLPDIAPFTVLCLNWDVKLYRHETPAAWLKNEQQNLPWNKSSRNVTGSTAQELSAYKRHCPNLHLVLFLSHKNPQISGDEYCNASEF